MVGLYFIWNISNSFVLIIIRLNSARLKRNNKLLKQIVEKRTADLQESNDKLNLLNSTKDKFFTIISHDLKSPFNSILGFTNLLAEDYNKFDETQKRKIISSLRESSQLAYELLENLYLPGLEHKQEESKSIKNCLT